VKNRIEEGRRIKEEGEKRNAAGSDKSTPK